MNGRLGGGVEGVSGEDNAHCKQHTVGLLAYLLYTVQCTLCMYLCVRRYRKCGAHLAYTCKCHYRLLHVALQKF